MAFGWWTPLTDARNINLVRRTRYSLGRWLLRPLSRQIVNHYADAMTKNHLAGKMEEGGHCCYILIGARYVGYGWPQMPNSLISREDS